jgi:2,3-bisphosphoglycerate-dependent phosphoglycerate mutase
MNTIIYFIRHAKTDISIKDDLTRPLSLEGIEKSKDLIKIFKEIKIDYIYSSPFKRAIQTIEPIAKSKNIKIKIINDFRERKMSNKWIENYEEYSKKQWDNFSYKLMDGESLEEVQKRNIKELEKILLEYKGKTIIIGTHGTALSTIINYYDRSFLHNNFLKMLNIMPYIMKMEFKNEKYINKEEVEIYKSPDYA